jgi:hypothetical protein
VGSEQIKGAEREKTLDPAAYRSDRYLSLRQLCSLATQVHLITALHPGTVLEVGIGNGFTSTFLRRLGIDVLTVDINPALCPDVTSSIAELPSNIAKRAFDVVVCCEVLEHIPFDQFEESLEIFRSYSRRLFLTLPSYSSWVGFSGFVRLPFVDTLINIGAKVRRPKDLSAEAHFWELGSSARTSRAEIGLLLAKRYGTVDHGVFRLNRYHEYFVCGNDA